MTSRNISIRDDLYERLTRLKRGDQSYSDLIESLLDDGTKGSFSRLMKYFGTMSDFPQEFEDNIINKREKANANLHARSMRHVTSVNANDNLPRQ